MKKKRSKFNFNIKTCKECNFEFESWTDKKVFCCDICKKKHYARLRFEKKQLSRKENELEGVENIDYVICKICNSRMKQISGKHLKICKPGMSIKEYKKEFNIESIFCKNSIKNFGKFMKEDKYRKMASEASKGQNNSRSKSKTTLLQRQQNSPFSKEFWIKKGLTEDEAILEVSKFAKNSIKDRLTETQLEYWLKKGLSEEDAKLALKTRQQTFTLEKCVRRYGEIEGTRKWKERQEKWTAKWKVKYNNGDFNTNTFEGSQSKIAKKFIVDLIEKGNLTNFNCCLNKEYTRYFKICKKTFQYDFVCKKTKRIIEFNGSIWHGDPRFFNENDIMPFTDVPYKKIWQKDRIKKYLIERQGYELIYIWEYDYIKNPQEVINKCLEFLQK